MVRKNRKARRAEKKSSSSPPPIKQLSPSPAIGPKPEPQGIELQQSVASTKLTLKDRFDPHVEPWGKIIGFVLVLATFLALLGYYHTTTLRSVIETMRADLTSSIESQSRQINDAIKRNEKQVDDIEVQVKKHMDELDVVASRAVLKALEQQQDLNPNLPLNNRRAVDLSKRAISTDDGELLQILDYLSKVDWTDCSSTSALSLKSSLRRRVFLEKGSSELSKDGFIRMLCETGDRGEIESLLYDKVVDMPHKCYSTILATEFAEKVGEDIWQPIAQNLRQRKQNNWQMDLHLCVALAHFWCHHQPSFIEFAKELKSEYLVAEIVPYLFEQPRYVSDSRQKAFDLRTIFVRRLLSRPLKIDRDTAQGITLSWDIENKKVKLDEATVRASDFLKVLKEYFGELSTKEKTKFFSSLVTPVLESGFLEDEEAFRQCFTCESD